MKISGILIVLILGQAPLIAQENDSITSKLNSINGVEKVKMLNSLFRENININPIAAIDYAREAKAMAEKINDDAGLGAAYNNLGVAYRNQGAVDKALEYYIKSLSIYESLSDKKGIATSKNNIATIYALKRDYSQALQYYTESNDLLVELKEESKIPGSLNNLGNIYTELKMFERALEHFNKAYQASEKLGIKFSDPLNNIGNVYYQQEYFQKAAEFYARALEIERAGDNKIGLVNTLTNLGTVSIKAKQLNEAEKYLNEALALSESLGAVAYMPSIYNSIAELYYQQKKYKEAYEMLKKYTELNDRINSEESSRRIAQMELALLFQEKETELDILRQKEELLEIRSESARIFVILGLMLLVLLVAFGYVYSVYKKQTNEEGK